MDAAHLWSLALSVFIGALIGTERTLRHGPVQGEFAGLRTFILLAEAGAISAWLAQDTGQIAVFLVPLAGTIGFLAVAYALRFRQDPERTGYSTELAGAITFLLGGATVYGHAPFAVGMAIVTSIVLALKEQLHATVRKLSPEELLAALRLLFASFVILPVLPREPLDPWGAVNPYELWLLVVLISGLSMAGYVAVRWTGATRGAFLTGVLGGLVSSTAVTLSLARRSHALPHLPAVITGAILLSWVVSFARVAVEVAIVHPALLWTLAGRLATMAAVALIAALALWLRARRDATPPTDDVLTKLESPFRLAPAIQFAAFFAVVLLAAALIRTYLPPQGLYALAVISGVADVDAITLSLARMAGGGEVGPELAASGILTAVTTNVTMKLVYGLFLGHPSLRPRFAVAGGAVVVAGLVASIA